MRSLSDDGLIDRALRGDSDAFGELIRRHEQPLAALICRRVSDAHEREDVFQKALLDAWRCLEQLRDRSKLRAWLVQIARNRCRDHHRSAARRDEPTPDDALEVYLNRFGRMVRRPESSEELHDAIRNIPPTQRRTAELFYFEGLTIKEIGQRLHAPEGTIKSRLFHARRALRHRLEADKTTKEKPG